MGLAASQARLLSLTARIHDVEFEAQSLQYAKMRLALEEDDVTKNYLEALDAETLSIKNKNGDAIAASFDNICGLGSINNNFGRNHYLFRDSGDNLIVPTEVYNGYMDFIKNCGSSDPYEFAMYMLAGDTNFDHDKFQEERNKCFKDTDTQGKLKDLYKRLDNVLEKIYPQTTMYQINGDEGLTEFQNKVRTELMNSNYEQSLVNLLAHFPVKEQGTSPQSVDDIDVSSASSKKEIEKCINDILSLEKESKHILYKNYGEDIFKNTVGQSANFDRSEFEYYVRWAKLIEKEGGYDSRTESLTSCIPGNSAYNNDIETNPEFLNEMIMSGRIMIDIVYDCTNGDISDTQTTSVATDSYISMTKTANIDSTAAKKAEAEYNHKLKEINRIDKQYDMSLNRLETERNALTTEYDSVKKVISENVERTFGIFS